MFYTVVVTNVTLLTAAPVFAGCARLGYLTEETWGVASTETTKAD